MAFRREKARRLTLTVKLRGLRADDVYDLEDADHGTKRAVAGQELTQGLRLKISTTPGSALLIYQVRK
jgi:hypothetical protein